MTHKFKIKFRYSQSPIKRVLDAQSVKWGNRKSDNGFDGNKKVKGIKKSRVVGRNGLILGRTVDSAGKHDSRLVTKFVERTDFTWPILKKILADRGYRGEIAEAVKKDFDIELEISNTPNGTEGVTPKPLRWVFERTFAWRDGFCRLARNYEETDGSAEEMIDFATIKRILKHI